MEVPSYDTDNCFSGSFNFYEHNLYSSPESITVNSPDINCEREQAEISLDYMDDLEYSLVHEENSLMNVKNQQDVYPPSYLQNSEENDNFSCKSRNSQKEESLDDSEQAEEYFSRMENFHEQNHGSLNLQSRETQTLCVDRQPLDRKLDSKATFEEIDLTSEKYTNDLLDSTYFVSVDGVKDWLITNGNSISSRSDLVVSRDNATNVSHPFSINIHKNSLFCESDDSFFPIINRPPPPPYRPPSKRTSAIQSVFTDSSLELRCNLPTNANAMLKEMTCVGRKTPPPPYCCTNSTSRKSGISSLEQDLPVLSRKISDGAKTVEKDNYLNFFPVAEFGDPFSEEQLLSSDGLPTPPIEITADRRVVFPPRWEIASMPTPPTDDEAGGIEWSFPLDGERFCDDGEELPEDSKPMVPADPKQWEKEHVTKWFDFCRSHKDFELGEINRTLLPENGNDLCQLTFDDFLQITSTKDSAEKLVHYLAKLLEGSGHSPAQLLQTISKSKHQVDETPFQQQQNSSSKLCLIKELYGKYFTKESKTSQTNGGGGQIQLWQFLLQLLFEGGNSSIIAWDGNDGEFRLINPEEVARRWGERKSKPNMNYDKLSRAIRYYYDKEMMTKVGGKRYTYRFDYEGLVRMCEPTGISDTCFIQPGFVPDSSNYNLIRNFSFHGVFNGKGRKT